MKLTPELLEQVEFREARRGYDHTEVDDFLERVAIGIREEQARLREALTRADGAEAKLREASESGSDDTETLRRTLVLAQKTADAAIEEAEQEAARIRHAAEADAASRLSEAEGRAAAVVAEAESMTRDRLVEQITKLERHRDGLQTDLRALERHVEAQRTKLRESVRELTSVLDNPDRLRVAPAPAQTAGPRPDVEVARPTAQAAVVAPPDPMVAVEPESQRAGAATQPVDAVTPGDPGGSGDHPVVDAAPPPETSPADTTSEPAPAAAGDADEPANLGAALDPVPTDPGFRAIDKTPRRSAKADEAYLAELRKAMNDDEPLGPREAGDAPSVDGAPGSSDDPPRSRFGRRR